MGKAEGIEVGNLDSAAWEEAMSSFRQTRPAAVRRQPTPMATLNLHAVRLMSTNDKGDDSLK